MGQLAIGTAALGILAAVAVPRVIDRVDEARASALAEVARAAATAMTVNFSGCSVQRHVVGARCSRVDDCADTGRLLPGGLPPGFTVAAAPIGAEEADRNGLEARCTITQTSTGHGATFTAISAGR